MDLRRLMRLPAKTLVTTSSAPIATASFTATTAFSIALLLNAFARPAFSFHSFSGLPLAFAASASAAATYVVRLMAVPWHYRCRRVLLPNERNWPGWFCRVHLTHLLCHHVRRDAIR